MIGINYTGTDSELSGCINDVLHLKEVLIEQYGYKEPNITILTDDTPLKPTCNNIIKALYSLVFDAIREDLEEVWISYSGHGYYTKDDDGEEKDNKDEVIIPLDLSLIHISEPTRRS